LNDFNRMSARRGPTLVRADQIEPAWSAQGPFGNAPSHRRATLFLDIEDAVVHLSGDERRRSARVEQVLMRVAEWRDDETAVEIHDGIDARRPALTKYRADDVHRSFDEGDAVEPAAATILDHSLVRAGNDG
jgi:hypothetical protein